ncbi:flagellar hook protein FlgE [Bryocella elongata]|uniref:Flagellar hook protein FlgE n=1 Tax=Bryocella elongata TaxID=863522 RepID=A0A1H5TKJ8_9BACT|nr:flagellar hook protein FlgE [Bryocella elongata]SEF62718.1 flagellar hook protein FlgE [Bryocella elongata]
MASFSIPLSGLTAAQSQLTAVSNNLANLNTDGYKDQTVSFSDIFAQASESNGAGDPIQTGSGVNVAANDYNFTEGSISSTGVSSNMALSGDGFFVTKDATGQLDYTRAGDFTTNNAGYLTSPSGGLVLGYPAVNGVVNTTAALQPLKVTDVTSPAVATSDFTVSANLQAGTASGTSVTPSSLTVYDSLGQTHELSISYTSAGNNTWNYSVTVPSSDLSSGGTGTTQVASGTLSFNSSGQLTLPSGGNSIAISIPSGGTSGLADGASAMNLSWNLEDASGNPTLTQTAAASGTSATTQNGYSSGSLSSYQVEADGTIQGTFSSGTTLALGQVAVASFANEQGLSNVGSNAFQPTAASGLAVIGVAENGGRGSIVGGSVEGSNVDISTEFAKLIVAQQAYSANAKSVTTFNQVSQATIAMLQ